MTSVECEKTCCLMGQGDRVVVISLVDWRVGVIQVLAELGMWVGGEWQLWTCPWTV